MTPRIPPPPSPIRVDPDVRYLAEGLLANEEYETGNLDTHRARVNSLAAAIQRAIGEWKEDNPV